MDDYIISRIQDIFNSVTSAGASGGSLMLSPQTFNGAIYSGVIKMMESGVMPVAYVILGLFFVLELYNITIRTEGQQGTMGIEIPFKVMFKIVLCKTAIDSTKLILEAMYAVSTQLINNIRGVISGSGSLTTANLDAVRTSVASMDFGVKLMTSVEVTLIYLIVQFVMIIITVIVVGRMIEVYVMMAVAPVPLATFPNAEMSSIAKNFLKGFAAVCLQGVLIYIVVAIFPLLFGNAAMGKVDDPANFSASMMNAAGYSFVLLISVFATGKWSKMICNAM